MQTMLSSPTSPNTASTFGQLCLANGEGRLSAQLDGDCYELRCGDIRRWLRDAVDEMPALRRAS